MVCFLRREVAMCPRKSEKSNLLGRHRMPIGCRPIRRLVACPRFEATHGMVYGAGPWGMRPTGGWGHGGGGFPLRDISRCFVSGKPICVRTREK